METTRPYLRGSVCDCLAQFDNILKLTNGVAAQEQEKLSELQQAGAALRERLQRIADKIEERTLEKGRMALHHAVRVRLINGLVVANSVNRTLSQT